ncbi:MAG: hypothetical protein IJZ08_08880 [Clostridia bacterium]|nr:hypothetical protein [Clostridia bacterium]
MKKILAFTLSVLLVVCGVLPAFVANTAAAEPTTLAAAGRTLPAEYVGGGTVHFKDFVKNNSNLAGPNGNTPGDYMVYETMYGDSVGVFNNKKFAATFYVDVPGVYSFCFQNWIRSDDTWNYIQADGTTKYPHPGTVQIDDGEAYTISANAVLAAGESKFNGGYYFDGLLVELTAGYHTIYISGKMANGANPYFMDAYWYCAERTGYYEDMPYVDAIDVTEVDLTETKIPGTFKVSVPYSGSYSVAALIQKTTESAGALTLSIDDTKFYLYELEDVEAGKTLYYDVAAGVELTAGEHTVTVGRYGAKEMPTVEGLVFATTSLSGITETNPYKTASVVNFQSQYLKNTQSDADGFNWYSWNTNDYKPSIGKAGIWIVDPSYTYTATFTPIAGGTYSLAMFLAHRTSTTSVKTSAFTVTISAGEEIIGEYTFTEFEGSVNSKLYYELAKGVRLEKDVEYTVAVQQAGATDSTIVDLLLAPDSMDGISHGNNNVNVGFENADIVKTYAFAEENTQVNPNGGYFYYWWNPSDFKGTLPGKYGVWLCSDYVYTVKYTPSESGAYSISAFLANNFMNAASVSGFNVKVSDADGIVGAYVIKEMASSDVGSQIYYHFADNVELEAGTEYTIAFSRTGATNSTVVEIHFELTSVVEKAIEESKKDDIVVDGAADEIPVGAINPLPGVGVAGEAENQPNMSVINPLPTVDENMNAPGMPEAEADSTTPPQPYGDAQLPAAPGGFGAHFQLAPMPAFMN